MNKNIAQSLIKVLAETKDIKADSVNPYHESTYASLGQHLEVLKPIFSKHGLSILQFPIGTEHAVGVRTIIFNDQGDEVSGDILIPCGDDTTGQDAGALITYLRRYALASVAGVATEDDDALAQSMKKKPSNFNKPKPSAPAPAVAQTVVKEIKFGDLTVPFISNSPSRKPILVPFGDRKGQPLASLPKIETNREVKFGDLNYFANRWTPKPFGENTVPSDKDLAIKAEAVRLWSLSEQSEQTESNPF